ncbi:hypothetical protein ABH922_003785 [Rhodococcus sp. 27YEA15]
MSPFNHQVSVEDDSFHTMPDGSGLWSESVQFTCYDPKSQIAAYIHWGLLSREIWEANFAIYLPNGEILVSRTFAPRREGEPMYTGQAETKPLEPLEKWQMTYDGVVRRVLMADLAKGPLTDGLTERVKVDLVGTASSPAFGKGMRLDPKTMTAHDKNPAVSGSGLHIEQSMRVTGQVEIHGETIEFDAVGHRDHSCGPRSNSHMWRESWINGTFPSGKTFHLLQIHVTGRPTYFMGYVWDGSEFIEVSNHQGPALTGPLGEPREFETTFDTAEGPQVIHGEILGVLPITVLPQGMYPGVEPRGNLAAEAPTRWTWNGEVGYGWTERVFTSGGWVQLRDADARAK